MRTDERLKPYLRKSAEVGALLLLLAVSTAIFIRTLPYTLPFVIGFLVAVSLWPIARRLEQAGASRRLSIVLTLVVVLGGIVALLALLIVQGAEEAVSLSQAVPGFFVHWRAWSEEAVDRGMIVYAHLPIKLVDAIQASTTSLVEQAKELVISFLAGLFGDVAVLPDIIFVLVISVIAAYFFMAEQEYLLRGFRRLLPPGWAPKLESVGGDVGRAMAGLLRAQLILIAVTCVVGVVGLAVMRMPYALLLGLAFGLTGWVPIVGSGVVILPWAIGALAMGHYIVAIKILLLQAIASLIRHTIEPKLLASNMGIGTFATLFGMYVGLNSIGFFGLLLGPICVIAVRSLIRARMFGDLFRDAEGGATAARPTVDHTQPKV